MAAENPKKLGELLVEKGFATQEQIKTGLDIQRKTGRKLGDILIESGIIHEVQLVEVIAERLKINRINLSSIVINPSVIATIPVDIAKKHNVLPVFKMANNLVVAMSDPLNVIALDEIRYLTKCIVKRAVAGKQEIRTAIDRYYSVADSVNTMLDDDTEDTSAIDNLPTAEMIVEGDSTVVKIVNLIITRAVGDNASDIHFEPDENQLRVRYRVNGVMREEAAPPKKLQPEIISRIKIAADLDVSEKRLPQDGRMAVKVEDRSIDLRVSTLPTIHGEKVVIRILDKKHLKAGLPELGMPDFMARHWHGLITKPEGLILISGPTSSGKTSTLYASLQEINSIEKNIVTVEDPVEYSLPLINQIQINEKAGLLFARALRSILRQNPDIIMVGEIRDAETAAIAVRASLTGHLVFSTIHTNDSIATITRLIDMGIERYMISSALEGILAQRLVRTICPECKEVTALPPALLDQILPNQHHDNLTFYQGSGCHHCRNTGYAGLTGVFELVRVSDMLRDMILRGASESEMRREASADVFRPLFETGIKLALEGKTTVSEILKVGSPEPAPIEVTAGVAGV